MFKQFWIVKLRISCTEQKFRKWFYILDSLLMSGFYFGIYWLCIKKKKAFKMEDNLGEEVWSF